MKALGTALGLLAAINLLGIAGFVAWLANTDRLDKGRLDEIREMLAETVTDQRAREAKEAAEKKAAEEAASADNEPKTLPVSSAETLAVRLEVSEMDRQRVERLRREIDDLTRALDRDRQALVEDQAAFEKRVAEFDTMRAQIAEVEGDAQFQKSLQMLEGQKADKAMEVLSELINADDQVQAVSYLNAMQDRQRNKVLGEFIDDDPALAATLLESIRLRGQEAGAP